MNYVNTIALCVIAVCQVLRVLNRRAMARRAHGISAKDPNRWMKDLLDKQNAPRGNKT